MNEHLKQSVYHSQDLATFKRYQPLIEDWTAFQDTLLRPLPTCIWTNPLRTTPAHLAQLLAAEGIPFEPLPWYPGAFKLPPDFKPGYHWAFLAGLYHVQEAVSMLPVSLLDPQPGERILDLCAAPGNKTAQIATRMANRGTVVANDISFRRVRGLRQTIERLGLANVTVTVYDGANYPQGAGLFDKVLVDVPCSCEGTSRKDPTVISKSKPDLSTRRSKGQKVLLQKAVQRCQPGGRIVYATCTYAPEENELVVEAILREYGSQRLRVMPARLENFTTSPGLTAWNGQQLHPSLRQTMRIWPHQNDSGGFFIAVLEKVKRPDSANEARDEGLKGERGNNNAYQVSALNASDRPPLSATFLKILHERFGISPDTFEPYLLFQGNADYVHLVDRDHYPPCQPEPQAVGVALMKTSLRYPKLSTAAAMLFGSRATRNYLDLDQQQIRAYTTRQNFYVSAAQSHHCTEMGYVLVRHQGFVLGVALYQPDASGRGGLIRSMFPKGWSPAED